MFTVFTLPAYVAKKRHGYRWNRPHNMNQANLLEATTSNLMRPGSSSSPDGNASAMTEELGQSGYAFPDYKLKKVMDDATKTPLVLVACGAFSPVTYLHLRMSEMVADYVRQNTDFEVVGEYLSPVSDAYKKKGLANAKHRFAILRYHSELMVG